MSTLPNVLHSAGFRTHWISNQSAKGLFDNIIGRYAALCDTSLFVGNKYAGIHRKSLDEEVITLTRHILQGMDSSNFYVIHLMGSHAEYKSRYSVHFDFFKENDYSSHYQQEQREILASYDNSVLYNDSVVYELFRLFRDKEAVVFYLSDHGEDVYESSDDFIGHGKSNNKLSAEIGKQVPFMVYTSSSYRKRFPDKVELMRKNMASPYTLDNIMYTIMDVAGVRFRENRDVEQFTLFQ